MCPERRTFHSTQEIANIKLILGDWKNHFTIAALLSELGASLQGSLSLCAIRSNEVLQQFCSARSECHKTGRWESKYSVVVETIKLLANNSYGYQIMDRCRHTVANYLSDKKTRVAINKKMFKHLAYKKGQLNGVELVKSETEHKEPIIVSFYILQFAKLRMPELFFNFFEKYCDCTKFKELETNTDSLYLALSEYDLYDCIW